MGIDATTVAELGTIVALSTTAAGAAQLRHAEGRVALGVGVGLLFVVIGCRAAIGV
jgi:hypothetical protein